MADFMSASMPALKHPFSFNMKCTTFPYVVQALYAECCKRPKQVLDCEYDLVSIKRKTVKGGAERKGQNKESWFKYIN